MLNPMASFVIDLMFMSQNLIAYNQKKLRIWNLQLICNLKAASLVSFHKIWVQRIHCLSTNINIGTSRSTRFYAILQQKR